ncbi:MAG TPA: transcriptional repressor LexA [Gammaproteobacteria bacterium]|nr:transcriptional repressor LexA [Gammaproteobacteria bacterium]
MLTQLEERMFTFIREHIESTSVSPTIAEIATALNIKSRGTVHRYVQSLIDKGHLEREGTGWRGLRLSQSFQTSRYVIPLLGKIAAGEPIEAIEGEDELNVAEFLIGPDRYALRVSGDSMMDAGILDGDTVILRKSATARAGEIVVALIDRTEATLKTLGKIEGGMVELVPQNSAMKAMRYAADRVRIQGVLVGQLRTY